MVKTYDIVAVMLETGLQPAIAIELGNNYTLLLTRPGLLETLAHPYESDVIKALEDPRYAKEIVVRAEVGGPYELPIAFYKDGSPQQVAPLTISKLQDGKIIAQLHYS